MQDPAYSRELRKIVQAIGGTPAATYHPSDDSYLMLDALAKFPLQGRKVLDMGTGSGILALFCAMHGADVTATDVDSSALRQAQKAAIARGLRLETKVSDLFSEVHERFNLITFNPPYLPSTTLEDRTIDGGPGGAMLSERFFSEIPSHLERDGTAVILASSLNEPESWFEKYPGLKFSVLAKRSLFFEELQALGVRVREDFTG